MEVSEGRELQMRLDAPAVKNAPGGNLPDREVTCRRFAATQALKRLSGLWKTPILLLLLEGPRRFAELERALEPISAKVLAERLRELERDGFLTRTEVVSEPPKTVEYRLTLLGEATSPVFSALAAWEQQARSAPAMRRTPPGSPS